MIGLFNPYFIGDSVMLEAVARKLSETTEVAIVSDYPELFIAHPVVKAYTLDDAPEDINLIDISNAIRGIKQIDGNSVYVENKIELMCQAAQIGIADIKHPELYLTPEEQQESKRLRGLIGGCNVGVVLESRHHEKDWAYMGQLVKSLTYKYHVHVIGQGIKERYPYLKDLNIIFIDNLPLRELMVHITALDIIIGVDTGPMHIAGALHIPIVVIGFDNYGYLYMSYENCRYLNARDLKTINIRKVYNACNNTLKAIKKRNDPPLGTGVSRQTMGIVSKHQYNTYVYVRPISGIGDAVMLRPVIIENIKQNPTSSHILYSKLPYGNIYKDIAGLDIINMKTNCEDAVNLIRNQHDNKETKIINVYSTCGRYEANHQPYYFECDKYISTGNVISKTRQDIWADEIGVKLNELDYGVKFFDNELEYADEFVDDRNIIVLHLSSADRWRDYIHKEDLIDFIAKHYDGSLFVMDIEYKYYGDKTNIITNDNIPIRKVWAIISKSKLLIGVDSAGVHLSGSVGVPTFGLFGPTDPKIRLKYDNVGWLDNGKLCENMPCWYQPCEQKYCLDIKPQDIWNSVIKRFGEVL